MKKVTPLIPWVLVAGCIIWLAGSFSSKPQPGFHTIELGRLPVLLNGRVQPLDSVARNSLLVIRTHASVRVDGKEMSASDWLAEAMMKPETANTRKIFRIDHPELLDLLKLSHDEKYFSFDQIKGTLDQLQQHSDRIGKLDEKLRTVFEKQVMRLANSLYLYDRIKNSIKPEHATNYVAELDAYEQSLGPGLEAVQNREGKKNFDSAALDKITGFLTQYELVSRLAYPLVVPPSDNTKRDEWENVGTSLLGAVRTGKVNSVVRQFAAMCAAYGQGNVAEFNKLVSEYRLTLEQRGLTKEISKGAREYFFNQADPFYKAMVLYVGVFLLACFYWVNLAEWLRRSAFYLLVLALAVHTFGLVYRMILEGRPPVTNLYSSAIFIGWGSAVLGLILERFFRDAIGVVTASAMGFVTLLIAYHLALISPTGDTMEMLRAVLDTNFWLTTHVVTITIGYSATFMAGFLAVIYILRGLFTRSLSTVMAESLTRMVYGIICFATLFSFVGTVLGGIWADQSWGRFWGWDPKENGALLIVLWNAAILHARWGSMIGQRGLMNMAIFGNIVTSFSWFGVNMLGVGLHSYGFMDQAFLWLMLFIGSQVGLIGLGCLPLGYWRSFRNTQSIAQPQQPASAREPKRPASIKS